MEMMVVVVGEGEDARKALNEGHLLGCYDTE